MCPTADVRCSLGDNSPAVAVFHTPQGCAARPEDKIQALCPQHIETDGLGEGAIPILDLTLGETWSDEAGLVLPLSLGSVGLAREATMLVAQLGRQSEPGLPQT